MKVSGQEAGVLPQVVSNSTAKASPSENGKESLQNATHRLARDVYHKENSRETSPVYSKPINISGDIGTLTKSLEDTLDEHTEDLALATAHLYLPGGKVPKAVEEMFNQYSSIMAELSSQQPSLIDKDWAISINKSGELEVSGSLNDQEKAFIEEKLNSNDEFVSGASDFKSNYLKYITAEYKGWAKYDVNENNFSEIFDLKELVESSQGDEGFKKTWGKDFSWLELTENISSQLRRNAQKI